ncbi:MAG: acetyl-CoA carboxylase carboxyltransferase subunit alpha [Candidatus Omnitrophica bacterium]|nr:acetyl-CoA carboxylase carboxyltransferase subunit alpha [Candidatus Omnitrophota bacterium]
MVNEKNEEQVVAEVYLPFEKSIADLDQKIKELKHISQNGIELSDEIKDLRKKYDAALKNTYAHLTSWQRVQVARHPHRPYTLNYIDLMMEDFIEISGDRYFGDDKAIVTGFARIGNYRVVVIGHQKGRGTKENIYRHFGSAHPEGYRKALRVMKLAERFNLPVITFIDTPGAYPGIKAEERGQAEAIAYNLRAMSILEVPIISVIIGEGGSGGALGIGVTDKIIMLENAYYSVISPEGCAAILWKDSTRAPEAAVALKITADELFDIKLIDDIVKEPLGGAHRDVKKTAKNLKEKLEKHLAVLTTISKKELCENRYAKYRKIGVFKEGKPRRKISSK